MRTIQIHHYARNYYGTCAIHLCYVTSHALFIPMSMESKLFCNKIPQTKLKNEQHHHQKVCEISAKLNTIEFVGKCSKHSSNFSISQMWLINISLHRSVFRGSNIKETT